MKFFPFASWEHPFWRSDLLQPAQLETARHIVQIEELSQRSWMFFRALESSDEASFVATPLIEAPFSGNFHPISLPNCSPLQLKTSLNDVLKKGKFARVFFLDENEHLRQFDAPAHHLLIVGATGWGLWVRLGPVLKSTHWIESDAPFVWTKTPDAARFLQTPARELWAQIEAQKADDNSDCAFARRFLNWSEAERQKRVWKWKNGSPEELKSVLKLALLSQNELWEGASGLSWKINLIDFRKFPFPGSFVRFLDAQKIESDGEPEVLLDILRRVEPFLAPNVDPDFRQHLAAARWLRHQNTILEIEIQNPSAHERLESYIQWREWQARNLSN